MFSHYDHQTLPYAPPAAAAMERDQWKLDAELAPNCPRCDSFNTKFCYYNNYSLTQPRYFCKGCRRYWTKGGSLRNVPIGDGCHRRKARSRKSVSAGTGRSSSGSKFSASLRPDLVLDEMVGNMSTDGPTIDLAVLYANFMNQRPVGEALDQMRPVQLQGQEPCCSMEESMLSTEDQVLIKGIGFGMDGCGNLQEEHEVMGDHHVFLPSCSSLVDLSTWEEEPRFQELDPLPEQYYNMLHDQEFAIGNWCTLDPSGLGLI